MEKKKKQYHRTNVSLRTTTVECVGLCVRVFGAIIRKWLTHTHSCVQTIDMSITGSDEVERRFFSLQYPQAGQTTDTPLKGNKTAPTTSKSCCILFPSEETCVIRTLPPICSPYVQAHSFVFWGIWPLGHIYLSVLCAMYPAYYGKAVFGWMLTARHLALTWWLSLSIAHTAILGK